MAIRMHHRLIFFLLFVTVALGTSLPASAQNKKKELQESKKKLEDEIQYNSELLEKTKKTKKTTLNQLVILKNQIASREKLIENINTQLQSTDEQIQLNNEILEELKHDLENLQDEYAKMIYFAYKNRSSIDRMMYIFAATDFNQAYKRLKYFQQYASYRQTQAELIQKTQEDIRTTINELEDHRRDRLELMLALKEERDRLNRSRNQQNTAYRTLSKKEKELVGTIHEKEKAASKLQKEIERIIAEEIRLASEKEGTTSTGTFALTPAELKLSASFEENKGGLPWPLEKGMISATFGEHAHPVLKQVKTKNNGIDLLTDPNTLARAVFNGEVTRVINIPNYNYVVMIRHGEYLSVYSNLAEVFVRKGDQITTKQTIGRIHTDPKESKTELHFELWRGKTLLNPSNWLAR
jgi:septal ring factor EnvC (AmiA/AmiB activator)